LARQCEERGRNKLLLGRFFIYYCRRSASGADAFLAGKQRDRRFNKSNFWLERPDRCNELHVTGIDFFDLFDIRFQSE